MENIQGINLKLTKIKQTLKQEFIGLDDIIDSFIQATTPWCSMASVQDRPLVVNLWGMTGVGKTSLVNRFLELWNNKENVVFFNLGSKNYTNEMLGLLEKMYSLSGNACVFIFDEFQHAKTMAPNNKELENPTDRMIWQLLDSGKFNFTGNWHEFDDIHELSIGLEVCLERGVKVENGKVIEGWVIYQNIMSSTERLRYNSSEEMEERDFIPKNDLNRIHAYVRKDFPYKALFRDFLFQMNGPEILEFIKKVDRKSCDAKELDFSKSLIFVLGNLDEAYFMSELVSCDHDADFLHEESKKITFSTIKEGLKTRFRFEEIARLGNVHLIYPSISGKVYRNFIQNELNQIFKKFENAFGCKLSFDQEIEDLLFEEGVTPSQGFRPVRSTTRFLIESSLVELLPKIPFQSNDKIALTVQEDTLILQNMEGQKMSKKLFLPVREAKRKKFNSQDMAVTAAHEAGHSVVYSILFQRLPRKVTIASSDFNNGGYMEGDYVMNFENYDHLIRETAVKLAGKKAEELIFGTENLTRGCAYDIKGATKNLVIASREGSVSGFDAAYQVQYYGGGDLLTETEANVTWVSNNLDKASQLAESILMENKPFLKALITLLLDKKFLTSESMAEGLTDAGLDISKILSSYPQLVNFEKKLSSFLKDAEAN